MIRPQFPLLPKQLVIASLVASLPWLAGPALAQTAGLTRAQRELLDRHCSACHNQDDFAGGIAFDLLDTGNLLHDAETWEKVLLKLQAGMMPPLGEPRPAAAEVSAFVASVAGNLDAAWASAPNHGAPLLHRMNQR